MLAVETRALGTSLDRMRYATPFRTPYCFRLSPVLGPGFRGIVSVKPLLDLSGRTGSQLSVFYSMSTSRTVWGFEQGSFEFAV
jgi:hypothetical protein